jgi:hypothetical protein
MLLVTQSGAVQSENSVKGEIIRLERLQWEAIKKKDKAALAAFAAKEYFDFGSDGRVDSATSLNEGWMSKDETLSEFTIDDPQVKLFDDHTALITYRGSYRGTNQGKPENGSAFYSDLYRRQDGKWLSVFTQDSNLKCAGL